MPGRNLPVEAPADQNWSCHSCGGCCRRHLIEISAEERARIDSQGWGRGDGPALPVYVPHGKGHRLAHTADGACVFLDESGLCRIHAKFGEEAKPLACRIFPYAFHPGGKKILVSLRFSCPSVVANRGKPPAAQWNEINRLAKLVVPAGADRIAAPRITDDNRSEWEDFSRFQSSLMAIMGATGTLVARRVAVALAWLELIEQAGSAGLAGPGLDDVLAALAKSADRDTPRDITRVPEPGGAGRAPFRLLLLQYTRLDTGSHLRRIGAYRWTLFKAAIRFTLGSGQVPVLREGFKQVAFADLEKPFGGIPPESEEVFARYFRVKIGGVHFCGPAYYQVPFVEGFRHLALLFAATLWMARWAAAGDGRSKIAPADVAKALAVTDHHHGYSPAFGTANFRRRVRMLAKAGDISRFAAWYSR